MWRIVVFLLLIASSAQAGNYYIGINGNDKNDGMSPAGAWRGIGRLNRHFHLLQPGDTVFFQRGGSFFGCIRATKSGSAGRPIVFTAYGSGPAPVISGLITLSGWEQKKTGVWQAPAALAAPGLNVVTLNGIAQRIGRYPNADAPDGGYLRYEEFSTNQSVTDKELNDGSNWTGAEVVIRKNLWTAERCRVTRQDGGTLWYTYASLPINTSSPPVLYNGIKGNGYFFQQDSRTLDQKGEWFFDSVSQKLLMYFGPDQPERNEVKLSVKDTLFDIGSMRFISISGLDFEGANISAVYCRGGSDISIQHCRFKNIGAKAIHFWSVSNVLIEDVQTNYILSNAIQVRNGRQDNVTVRNCVIKNTGPYLGMGSWHDARDYKAVSVMVRSNLLIENNRIDSCGLSAIEFQGNNVLVQKNYINYFCYLLDDGAGIYTYADDKEEGGLPNVTNRKIKNNIIIHGIGAPQGSLSLPKAEGIYLDGYAMNVEVTGNSIAHTSAKALATNNPLNVTFSNNTCFDNGGGWGATRLDKNREIQNLVITNNIFYPLNAKDFNIRVIHTGLDVPVKMDLSEALQVMGRIDSNCYNTINPAGFLYIYSPEAGKPLLYPSPLTLEKWQDLSRQDMHSVRPAKKIPGFVLQKSNGQNMVVNGDFDKNMKAVSVVGSNTAGKWDHSGAVSGRGSLKVEFSKAEPNRYALVHGVVGNIDAGKKYLLRFKTKGTSGCGILKAYVRKTTAPYTAVVPGQVQTFSDEIMQHEFVFSTEVSAAASFVIEIEKNSCSTFIDDIEFFEVDATVIRPEEYVRFEYNATDKAVTIPLDKNYVGVDGSKYSGSLLLLPFESRILIEDIHF